MITSLPGFRDFYPEQLAVRRHLFTRWREVAGRYGFREYDGPPLEPLELFTQKSGDEIVKQLYNFVDKGERAVALRPEMTPTLARMVGARHRDYKKPIKWFALPQLFRYERQQRGRLREHFQYNADIIGEPGAGADAELVALAIDSLRALGLTAADFVVRISDRRAWQQKLAALGVAPESQYGALQAIDKLEREPAEQTRSKLAAVGLAPAGIDELLAFAGQRTAAGAPELQQVLDQLGHLAQFLQVDFTIVRGLAYYTGIVWEIHDRRGELRALAGGGRYDNLIKLVTGVDLPALGFGMGDVTVTELLKDRGLLPPVAATLDVYVVVADETLQAAAARLVHELRAAGLAADHPLGSAKVGKQFQAAAAAGARYAVVVGPDEWAAGEVMLKNLASGDQQRIAVTTLIERLRAAP
jgi:histidyl-tRNA synthetase